MQSDPAYRSIPIIMMSANHEYRGIELYATVAFLNKPFSLDKLFGAITAAISHSGSQ
jgi:DNA-binding response OmpR family regulator